MERHSEACRLIHQDLNLEQWAAALESGRKAGAVAWESAEKHEKWAKYLEAACTTYEAAVAAREKR